MVATMKQVVGALFCFASGALALTTVRSTSLRRSGGWTTTTTTTTTTSRTGGARPPFVSPGGGGHRARPRGRVLLRLGGATAPRPFFLPGSRAAFATTVTVLSSSAPVLAVLRAQGWRPPRTLFEWHPLLTTLALPLTTGAVLAVRSRAGAAARAPPDAKRRTLEDRIKVHFALSILGTWAAVAGVGAVAAHKALAGRPHLASIHAGVGAVAVALWLLAVATAEHQVWRKAGLPRFRAGRFVYKPQWIWSSKRHRLVSKTSFFTVVAAVASGLRLTTYGATKVLGGQEQLRPPPVLLALAALAATMLATFRHRLNK